MAKLEAHRRYIDIQLVLDGTDEMGWKPLSDCHDPVSDYSTERDIRFFNDARQPGSPRLPAASAFSS